MIGLVRRRASRQTARPFNLPAPMGSINTVSSGALMPPEDCIYRYNMIPAEYGLRVRLGSREWVTGIGEEVQSLLPFTGSTSSGSRLFAATQTGIWDVTTSSAAPTQVVVWPSQDTTSGHCISFVFSSAAGHFLCVFDESNGYYVYSESGASWTAVIEASGTEWKPGTAYLLNDYTTNKGISYRCTTGGTSVGSPWVAGTAYIVGDVVISDERTYRCAKAGTSQGASWQASTAYTVGQLVTNGGNTYRCTESGTSAGSGGPTGTSGTAIEDNTAVWEYNPDAASGPSGTGDSISDDTVIWDWVALGPSGVGSGIADGSAAWEFVPSIGGVDPANLVAGVMWKRRIWMVERGTGKGWYLGTNAIGGAATEFNFGAQFQKGGALRGLYSWTGDGGAGIDDQLVAVSDGGDVSIYAGTDPATSGAFGLRGVWSVGGIPLGRRICSDFGGELLIMSTRGILSIRELVDGLEDTGQYRTGKIANLWNKLQLATANLRGWTMALHPLDASLIVTVPTGDGLPSRQLAMSLTTKGWSEYRDLDMGVSCTPYGGTFYFGTVDGKVKIMDGYVDGVTLADPNSYAAIQWSLLTAFQGLGNANQKQIGLVEPSFISEGAAPSCSVEARYRYDFSEIGTAPVSAVPTDLSLWDTALWDEAVWAPEYAASHPMFGTTGMGPEVALAIRGTSVSRTILAGVRGTYTSGGFL